MPSMEERMKALLGQFTAGRISAETYQQMLDSLLGLGGVNQTISDSVVKQHIDRSLHVHMAGAAKHAERMECSHCKGTGVCPHSERQWEIIDDAEMLRYWDDTLRFWRECDLCGKGIKSEMSFGTFDKLVPHTSGVIGLPMSASNLARIQRDLDLGDLEPRPPFCKACNGTGQVNASL